jgi:hypothetical protein
MNNDSRTRLDLSLTGSPTRKIVDMTLFPFICLVGVISKIFQFEKPFSVFFHLIVIFLKNLILLHYIQQIIIHLICIRYNCANIY